MINKILLVIPNYNWSQGGEQGRSSNILWHFIPYNLCLLAAVLEQENRYEIKVIDALAENLSTEEFEQRIRDEKPDFVGISVLMDFYGYTGHLAAEIIKKIDPNIVTGLGGVHATANPGMNIMDQNYDYVMCGEGEEMLPQLIHYINGERDELPKGVWILDEEGKVKSGGHSDLITNLDQFPLPAYHLIDYSQYSMRAERKSLDGPAAYPYARILTSRGCPFNCCFCQVEKIAGRTFRPRSAENILKEIDWLVNTYGIKSLIFDD
ncbi:MAG: B12-binding domain-containing radical SAM protein, partial [Roseburia sp.]